MNRSQIRTIVAEIAKLHRDVKIAPSSSVDEGMVVIMKKVLKCFQDEIKDFILDTLTENPIVGKWAERISTTVAEFIIAVVHTIIESLILLFSKPEFWSNAHKSAMVEWDRKESDGRLFQILAYSRKMSGYLLEIFRQCLERSIEEQGLELSVEEKDDISEMLDQFNV